MSRRCARDIEEALRRAGCPQARAEAERLLSEALRVSRTDVYLSDAPLEPEVLQRLGDALSRRLAGEPLQYIFGRASFHGREFLVSPAVLIPRPETEILVDEAVGCLRRLRTGQGRPPLVIDVGTGSGAVAVSLSLGVPACLVGAVELSWEAFRLARANIARHDVSTRVWLIRSQWTEGLRGPIDLIVSNPPYVRTGDLESLPAVVRREPAVGLDGGPDGMAFHRRLLADAKRLLAPGGSLCMESAEDQTDVLERSARALSWPAQVRSYVDLTGRPRGVVITRRSALRPD
ncbi:MAG: peptide chain release factor N(5)-glutamine methyltransferase [Candidatus Omnitrophica bacterium]|nr:peptide chain release factor N(5)-glutamine methyltransferase [Candidatus Omnitrophota bacterium]